MIEIMTFTAITSLLIASILLEREKKRTEEALKGWQTAARQVAQEADAEIERLCAENEALREQLRLRGVIAESALKSAQRFQRARFDRGIEVLRQIGE